MNSGRANQQSGFAMARAIVVTFDAIYRIKASLWYCSACLLNRAERASHIARESTLKTMKQSSINTGPIPSFL